MKFHLYHFDDSDIAKMRCLLRQPGNELKLADFNELIALEFDPGTHSPLARSSKSTDGIRFCRRF